MNGDALSIFSYKAFKKPDFKWFQLFPGFQMVSASFWVVSGSFQWFQVTYQFSKSWSEFVINASEYFDAFGVTDVRIM